MTIADLKRLNKAHGGHWFSKSTLRFFNSVIESKLYGDKYFVTSERMNLSDPKRYSIREVKADGHSIGTVGNFQAFNNLDQAILMIKYLLKTGSVHR